MRGCSTISIWRVPVEMTYAPGAGANVGRLHSCPGARDPGIGPSMSERKPSQKRSSLCVVRMVAQPAQQPSGIPSTFRD
jgi:hypothetical protein